MIPNRFFVYGTLCRGNCRSKMWPHSPEWVESAWVMGTLYNGPGYPAMRQGDDKVKGEVWTFRDEHVAEATRVLDRIEGTNQSGMPNLYDRIAIETFSWNNQLLGTGWTYHYATDPALHGFTRIMPTETAAMAYWLADPA